MKQTEIGKNRKQRTQDKMCVAHAGGSGGRESVRGERTIAGTELANKEKGRVRPADESSVELLVFQETRETFGLIAELVPAMSLT